MQARNIFDNVVVNSSMIIACLFFMIVSGAEIGRFVAMMRNPSLILKTCVAFDLLQVKEISICLLNFDMHIQDHMILLVSLILLFIISRK